MPRARTGPAPLVVEPNREWRPLPWPLTLPYGPPIPGPDGAHEHARTSLVGPRMAWPALMSWVFGVIVLIMVIVPTAAIPKLTGGITQPVSAAAYGPIIAIFAIVSLIVAVGGGLWLWSAMCQEYEPGDDQTMGG